MTKILVAACNGCRVRGSCGRRPASAKSIEAVLAFIATKRLAAQAYGISSRR